jgi:PilZ domain-containing protein
MGNAGAVCRRRAADPRHPVRVSATIEAAGPVGRPQPGRIVNLSQGGLSLQLHGLLDPGTLVTVTLHLQGRAAPTVAGRFAWVDRAFTVGAGSAGVAFKDRLPGELVANLAAGTFPANMVAKKASTMPSESS